MHQNQTRRKNHVGVVDEIQETRTIQFLQTKNAQRYREMEPRRIKMAWAQARPRPSSWFPVLSVCLFAVLERWG
jgi:hypothetical protein